MSVVAGANSSGSSDVVSKCLVATQKQCEGRHIIVLIDWCLCVFSPAFNCIKNGEAHVFEIKLFSEQKLDC